MQDSEIPRWALDNRRCHVKGHRSAQRDLQEAVRPDSSIREPTDATGRTAHQWPGSKETRAGLLSARCNLEVLELEPIQAPQGKKIPRFVDPADGDNPEKHRYRHVLPGRNVTRAKPSRQTRTQELNSSEPRRYGCCCYMLVTLVLQLDWSVGRVSTYPIALVPPSQSAVTHDT